MASITSRSPLRMVQNWLPPWVKPKRGAGTWPISRMTWARWWAGTSMSEPIALGESDADARWIAIRRHQAVLVIVGLGLVGDWLVRASSQIVELAGGVTLLVCAAPAYDALTLAELLWVGACFLARSRWTLLGATNERGALSLRARGQVRVWDYSLRHRGRLDLS